LPQRGEMDVKTDFAPTVHFMSLAIELRKLHFNRGSRVSRRNLKLQVELVLYILMYIPALSVPPILLSGGALTLFRQHLTQR
jgi:hypothetical protein